MQVCSGIDQSAQKLEIISLSVVSQRAIHNDTINTIEFYRGYRLLRVAILTSEVHYVPDNYLNFLRNLDFIGDSKVTLVRVYQLQNWNQELFFKALGLLPLAPRLARQLLTNGLGPKRQLMIQWCHEHGIPFTAVTSVASQSFRQELKDQNVDLLINARTRAIFGKKLLATPRLGCLNIHHGLLPDQRGTFCDFHALRQRQPSGFTIHRMSEVLDDGEILAQQTMPYLADYPSYLALSAAVEGRTLSLLLKRIAEEDRLPQPIRANTSDRVVYYKTPGLFELMRLERNGVKI